MKSVAIALAVAALTSGCTTSTPDDDSATSTRSRAATTSAPTSPHAIDCGQATGDSEKKVCADPELVALDTRLADLYQQAVSESGSENSTLEAQQRGWVAGRDDAEHQGDIIVDFYGTALACVAAK